MEAEADDQTGAAHGSPAVCTSPPACSDRASTFTDCPTAAAYTQTQTCSRAGNAFSG